MCLLGGGANFKQYICHYLIGVDTGRRGSPRVPCEVLSSCCDRRSLMPSPGCSWWNSGTNVSHRDDGNSAPFKSQGFSQDMHLKCLSVNVRLHNLDESPLLDMTSCCGPQSLRVTNKAVQSLLMHAGMCNPFAHEVQAFNVCMMLWS